MFCGLKSVLDLILAIGITKIESRIINLTDHLIDRLKAKKHTIISLHENQSERLGVSYRQSQFSDSIEITNRSGTIRLAPHFYNTYQELDFVVNMLP